MVDFFSFLPSSILLTVLLLGLLNWLEEHPKIKVIFIYCLLIIFSFYLTYKILPIVKSFVFS